MNYLLYCVLRASDHPRLKTLRGVGGQPVYLIAKNGLAALVSRTSNVELAPAVRRVVAYEKVIQSIHRHCAVIPFRYSSVFARESQVSAFLQERGRQYKALLGALQGSVEMSIHVVFDRMEPRATTAEHSGTAYMAAQEARYAAQDRLASEQELLQERICGSLSGLFLRSKADSHFQAGRRIVSMHFLISRKSITAFRKAFRRMKLHQPAKLLLSGPWPPHNFVL